MNFSQQIQENDGNLQVRYLRAHFQGGTHVANGQGVVHQCFDWTLRGGVILLMV